MKGATGDYLRTSWLVSVLLWAVAGFGEPAKLGTASVRLCARAALAAALDSSRPAVSSPPAVLFPF